MGIIDTSKWQASNGNQVPQPPTVNGQFMPIQSGINGNMNGIKMANSNTDWSDATSPFNGNRVRRIPSLYVILCNETWDKKLKHTHSLTTIIINHTNTYAFHTHL